MANEILRTLLPLAGWTDERTNELSITGGTDPILPTSFRIGEFSASALGALGLAVSDLWEARTGRRQEVSVDTRRPQRRCAAESICIWMTLECQPNATP